VRAGVGETLSATAPTPARKGLPRPRVLCVDDEPQVLESLRDSLRRRFEVVATTNGFEALRLLVDEPCEVVLSDMRMPMLNGARFLTLAREHAPDTVRLLLTGQSTVEDAVAVVNDGEIFRFLVKPCSTPDLIAALDSAVSRHRSLKREREVAEQMLGGTLGALTAIATELDSTGPARAERVRRQAVALAEAVEGATPSWELERACELMALGAVSMTPETRAHLVSGRPLGKEHGAELERLPGVAERFLAGIPRLEPVRVLLAEVARPFVPTSHGVAGTSMAARILRVVLDFDVLEAQGVPPASALALMRGRSGRYDDRLLDAYAEHARLT
jgi:DNA-binding response OmpR family regulator